MRCDVTCVMLQGHFLSGEIVLTVEKREGEGVFFKIASSTCKAPGAYTASHSLCKRPVRNTPLAHPRSCTDAQASRRHSDIRSNVRSVQPSFARAP